MSINKPVPICTISMDSSLMYNVVFEGNEHSVAIEFAETYDEALKKAYLLAEEFSPLAKAKASYPSLLRLYEEFDGQEQ